MTAEERLIAHIGIPIERKSLVHEGLSTAYTMAGKGPPLVLLHGLNMGWGQWYANIAALAEQYRVCAIDLPGAGASSNVEVGALDLQERLQRAVLRCMAAEGIDRPAVMGHSSGAWLAMRMALSGTRFQKMILTNPLGFTRNTPAQYRPLGIALIAKLLSRTAMRISKQHMAIFTKSVCHHPERIAEVFVDYYYESLATLRHAHPFLWINWLAGVRHLRPEFYFGREISALTMPVLIVAGAHDPIVRMTAAERELMQSLQNGRIEIFPESGHVPFTEEPSEYNRRMIEFLKAP